ncbi:uncharacterized protein LAESUDRAFT_646696 [Laetiporus sulphureus 93-53]|uniref:rRNA-processing protein FYV7 n=1 Tax=Laetiporus sulphureus 93-53 TaxID=1314785 RepID=A0A165FVT6_9APHY|nr:uncharacterized protein LAESUDRAFT_646696 [Laetiporus sulphureus 93-53]KZT09476.1 hypothetical protein LAESUDRAFT_646696 [Laetiporus sulphureus 93-53]
MVNAKDGTKKRKPPTFRHLPVNRAKKLKQSWVEVQKVKSQWKAQKRKEGIITKGRQLEELVANEQEVISDLEEGDDELRQDSGSAAESGAEERSRNEEDGNEGDSAEASEDASSPRMKPPSAKETRTKESTEEKKPTLRDLQRQAYSRTSLHTHKSDPLHSRRGADASRGTSSGGRGRGQERGRGRGRGASLRGQPDMRLRMNALLEKIKRDFA